MTERDDDRAFSRADEVVRLDGAVDDVWRVRPVPQGPGKDPVGEGRGAAGEGKGSAGKRRDPSGGGKVRQDRRKAAETLVKAFNSWAFKREQPDDAEGLIRLAAAAIEAETPLRFVLYWGRGFRARSGPPELQCLDFLLGLVRRVENLHGPGAELTLVFTDTHAALNGHDPCDTARYFAQVEREASRRGFGACRLDDLVLRAAGLIDPARALEAPRPDLLAGLVASAAKWYRGGRSAEEGAREYYRANMIEKQAVEAAFRDAVFITFNGSEHRPLFPDTMPIFYMYSLRRGVAVKPWFIEAAPEDGADPQRMEPAL